MTTVTREGLELSIQNCDNTSCKKYVLEPPCINYEIPVRVDYIQKIMIMKHTGY